MTGLKKTIFLIISLLVFMAAGTASAETAVPTEVTQACKQEALSSGDISGGLASLVSGSSGVYQCVVQGESGGGSTFYFDASGHPTEVNGAVQNTVFGSLDASGKFTASICDADVSSWRAFFTPSCWGPMISGVVSGALVYVASWMLTVAGFLFDWALSQTILNFGALVTPDVVNGINTAWTVGRDISNIIIIAMFTFIAIATILGDAEFGVRRMLARVLIVAVLINFSLLFSKLIIDISNFTAGEFYAAAQTVIGQPVTTGTVSVTTTSSSQPAGVSGAFMKYAGVSSFGDTYKAIGKLATQQNSWIALLFGIFTALLFIIAAVILLYGTFLLVTRALVLIFLMITASLAFATYLWPKLSDGGYGWNAWWNALLKNAVFAPLLMFFLWVTLTLGAAFSKNSGSLGQLLTNPQSSVNISALLGYMIVIGLLFASFRLSSSFASTVSGLNLGQYAFDLGRSRLGGLTWQQTVGRFAYNRERAATTNARGASAEAERIRRRAESAPLTDFDKKSLKALDEKVAKNTRRANTFGSLANKQVGGVQGFAGGIGKPPTAAREVRKAQDRAANAEKQAAPAQTQQQNPQMDELLKQQRELNTNIATIEKERADLTKQHTEAFNKLIESNKEAAEAQKAIASDATDRKQIEDKHSEEMIKKQIETATANMDPNKRAEIEHDIRRNSEEQRASELRHQDEKIERAHAGVKQITANDPILSDLQKRLEAVDQRLGVQRAQAKDVDQKILVLQNNAPAGTTTGESVKVTTVESSSDDITAYKGANKRVVRAEILSPKLTDSRVIAHTEATIQEKSLETPGQQVA